MNFYLTAKVFRDDRKPWEVDSVNYCIDSFNKNVRDKGHGELKGIIIPDRFNQHVPNNNKYRDIPVFQIHTIATEEEEGYTEASQKMTDWNIKSRVVLNFQGCKQRNKYGMDNEHNILLSLSKPHLEFPCVIMDSDLIINEIDSLDSLGDNIFADSSFLVYVPNETVIHDFFHKVRRLKKKRTFSKHFIDNGLKLDYLHMKDKMVKRILLQKVSMERYDTFLRGNYLNRNNALECLRRFGRDYLKL